MSKLFDVSSGCTWEHHEHSNSFCSNSNIVGDFSVLFCRFNLFPSKTNIFVNGKNCTFSKKGLGIKVDATVYVLMIFVNEFHIF